MGRTRTAGHFVLIVWLFLSISLVESFSFLSPKCPCRTARRPRLCFSAAEKDDDRELERWNSEIDDESRRRLLMWSSCAAALSLLAPSSNAIEGSFAAFKSPSTLNQAYGLSYDPSKPFSSVRRYKSITLQPNGLRVVLVSDKRAYRSSAALTVQGAGQFSDPADLPGCAHLMEHMILSSFSKSTFRKSRDFEDWLGDIGEGASNAFTAYDNVCFHFSCVDSVFQEALERFAGLFEQYEVERICRDAETLRREVRRVDSELDFDNTSTQAFYLSKTFVNPEHPYASFSAGSLESLERRPKEAGCDVGEKLFQFFKKYYRPYKAVLVVVGPQDIFALERWVSSFSTVLSKRKKPREDRPSFYPGYFLQGNRLKHMILFRSKQDNDKEEKLTFEWALNLDYREIAKGRKEASTASQVAFVLNKILGRRGPGSLYYFLQRRGWIPPGVSGFPRMQVAVDVSGFQVLKLEIGLTLEGFANRAAVVSAVYDSLETLRTSRGSFKVSRDLLAQYATIAKLHGFVLSPRPPDAIELAIDAQLFGIDTTDGVGSGKWYRFPSTEDRTDLAVLQRNVASSLENLCDPSNAVIIATASISAITKANSFLLSDTIPLPSSSDWLIEPVSGARFVFDDMLRLRNRVEELVLTKLVAEEELSKPVLNPLVPGMLRPARVLLETSGYSAATENLSLKFEPRFLSKSVGGSNGGIAYTRLENDWRLLEATGSLVGLPLPRGPPESTIRCAFTLELLSPRPARADVRQAARSELWRQSFEAAVVDLAELGAPGGLAYDLSFNKYGLRLCFLGISQTLPSYARRFCRRLVTHSLQLLQGPESLPTAVRTSAISSATRARNLSPQRKRRIISNLRSASAYDAAGEGAAFLRSCTGAVCFAQGDLLKSETIELLEDLQNIFKDYIGDARSPSATPSLEDIRYKPAWKPRAASSCSVAGVTLLSDACGRIPR